MQHTDKNETLQVLKWNDVKNIPPKEFTRQYSKVLAVPGTYVIINITSPELQEGTYVGKLGEIARNVFKFRPLKIQKITVTSISDIELSEKGLRCIKYIFSTTTQRFILEGTWASQTLQFIASAPKLPRITLVVSDNSPAYLAFLNALPPESKVSLRYPSGCVKKDNDNFEEELELIKRTSVGKLSIISKGCNAKQDSDRVKQLSEVIKTATLSKVSITLHDRHMVETCLINMLGNKNISSIYIDLINFHEVIDGRAVLTTDNSELLTITLTPRACDHLRNLSVSTNICITGISSYPNLTLKTIPFIQSQFIEKSVEEKSRGT